MSAASGIEVEFVETPDTLRSARMAIPPPPAPTVPAFGEGKKYDAGKRRADLLPAKALNVVGVLIREAPLAVSTPQERFENAYAEFRAQWDGPSYMAEARLAASLLEWLEDEHAQIIPADNTHAASVYEMFPHALHDVASVLTFGASKYGANNWQNVTPFRERYTAAMVRHVIAHCSGEVADPESGLPHLAHASTNALFLLSAAVGHDLPLTELK